MIVGHTIKNSDMQSQLSSMPTKLITHLMKIYLMPNHTNRNHWKDEIYTFINNVSKLKGTHEYPTPKQIYDWIYKTMQDCFTDSAWFDVFITNMCDSYNIQLRGPSIKYLDDFDTICESYFKWLANILGIVGIVKRSAVFAQIDKLIPKRTDIKDV